jgi:hypothetical protein
MDFVYCSVFFLLALYPLLYLFFFYRCDIVLVSCGFGGNFGHLCVQCGLIELYPFVDILLIIDWVSETSSRM